jgi:hypothetical protein
MARKLETAEKQQTSKEPGSSRIAGQEPEDGFLSHLAEKRDQALKLSPELDASLSLQVRGSLLS